MQYYSVRQFCNMVGVPYSSLRYYERIGLLKPKQDEHNNYRAYTPKDAFIVNRFKFYRSLGFEVKEAIGFIENEDEAYYNSVGTVGIFETLGSPESWVAGVRNLSPEAPESKSHVKVLTEARNQLDEAIEQGWAYKADSIAELAEYFGLENLEETVKTYNEMCANGKDTEFYKDATFLTPITEGPFYIFEYEPSAWCTLGGVKVDDSLRVVNADNEPIKGLYAAGVDAGSLFTAPYYDNEGSAFGLSLGSGTLSGRNMAAYVKSLEK